MTKVPTDTQWADLASKINAKQNALTFDTTPTSGSSNPVTSGGVYTAVQQKAVGTTENYSISSASWTALSNASPYTYATTVTATTTISANTIVRLLNDQPVNFAKYGFAVASVSGQTVTIYSIGQPTGSVTLKINYRSGA